MKRKGRITAIIVLVVLVFTGTALAQELSRKFLNAVDAYEKGQYEAAANGFSRIAESGVRNGKLYYNIGNAWFKAGDIGRAILWYERAMPLRPGDPELVFNLSHARSFVKDKAPAENALWHAIFFWRDMVQQRHMVWIAVIFNGLFAIGLFWRMVLKRYLPSAALYGCLFVVLAAGGTAGFNMAAERMTPKGIVLPASVSVKSGISDLSTELFVLHAGTKVSIEAEKKGYCRIRFADEKMGWVKQDNIGII
ncbi:MAG: hypothetical protein SWH68_04240 [Thermodesulfobacteriota bacterium]|nr:hypothetical protein [Thermodesulfobacteriota bacterium]